MSPSYNNSFGSLSSGGTSGGTGDVVLTASPVNKKGSSKKLVVVILLLLVLVGAGVGAGMWMMNKPESVANVEESFNKLFNYVVSGEITDRNSDATYNLNEKYYFISNQSTPEAQTELYTNVHTLLTSFIKSYNNMDSSKFPEDRRELLNNTIDEVRQLFEFMQRVYTKKAPSVLDIQEKYFESGRQGAIEAMNNYYDLNLDNNKYASNFRGLYETWVKNEVDVLDYYRVYGCLVNGAINYTCVEQEKNNDSGSASALSEKVSEVQKLRSDMNYYYNRTWTFMYDMFLVDALFNNKNTTGLLLGGQDD